MTFEEAQQLFIDRQNEALVKHGNYLLLDKGMSVDDAAFRKSMLRYAGDLEEWRMWATQEVAIRAFGATTAQSTERH
ncbi:hypothetical protein ABIB75_001533 [Bradyrhizobium sp. GM2.2]|jgi:hypothetical protein|uniref:hypothetical protein n=1 Tax=unclassified Bradyrhizobium TaxID=2631580 RepID=UPI001FFA242B|nr:MULTISPECIES: hypothetical protein [unclassified Bradyrhizobium]MCK1289926.1 hypothetical protein [Bradyrhizobium sp. 30]MCK1677758.1 hypothetical protein [Bradyrhizobium sp. 150]